MTDVPVTARASETPFFTTADWIKLAIVVAVIAVDAVWIAVAGFRFDVQSLGRAVIALTVLMAVALFYTRWRPFPRFVTMTKETAWLIAFSAGAAVLSNLVVTLNLPLADTTISAIDRTLGFDWQSYYAFVTARPILGYAYVVLYAAVLPMIAFTIIALGLLDRPERASETILSVMIAALIAIAISGLLPTAGGLAWFRPDEATLAHRPIVNLAYKQAFFDLRAGAITSFSLDDLKGLIAFPSYHAALNGIVVLAFRGIGRVFWPLCVLNVAMLATTPVEGGHHLMDALGGCLVAVLSTWLAWRLCFAPANGVVAPLSAPVQGWSIRKGRNSASSSESAST